ncbi:ABC transporter ATP-binding protein [Pseudooceanicola sp. CBS1P-1]|uniref:ATP-binding cassette domain-containing protein n=1 Tax=Pseudooceanicola albus TaxID=2692189 RepID=A0A6L7G9U3_9RHOB|nr:MULTISPECIES: ABC transporter ATP-binding protein [Pseudooceanicola]MBT9386774.1 ABC transporter ATP-binding protein [Pseudooceanicola endophyticus]MXN20964.1 ATP-binding cassette domain-containing protein [Pseudooceanicola albus]
MSQDVPVLQVSGLRKSFGAITVARDLDLEIRQGECVGVIGPNGAGKSSVFSLIAGVLAADGGRVILDGTDVTRLPAHRRVHHGIGRAFQIPQPFAGLTVYENVLSAACSGAGLRGSAASDWACEVLERTGLARRADTLAGALMLLDRKNLEVAKAVATRAKLLMLDEIGAGLTEREVAFLIERIAALKQDHAIIWIEHIAHALKAVADRIVVLNFGEKVADGPFDAVMSSAVVREIYMGLKEEAGHAA